MAPTPKVGLDGPATLQASAPGELRGVLGRLGSWLGYLCMGGGKAMFVTAADLSMPACTLRSAADAIIGLLIAALSTIH